MQDFKRIAPRALCQPALDRSPRKEAVGLVLGRPQLITRLGKHMGLNTRQVETLNPRPIVLAQKQARAWLLRLMQTTRFANFMAPWPEDRIS